jgi:hypothetical protein
MMVDQVQLIVALEEAKLGMERDRVVAVAKSGKESEAVKELDTRIGEIVKQIAAKRTEEEGKAKARQFEMASGALAGVEARIADLKKKRDEKQADVRRLDGGLAEYKALEEVVRGARNELNEAQATLSKEEGVLWTIQPRVEIRSKAKLVEE